MTGEVAPFRKGDDDIRIPRVRPSNVDAEQQLLGSILVNNAAYLQVAELVKAEDFSEPVHQRIFAAAAKLIDRGQSASGTTLRHVFDADGALAEIGGGSYLGKLAGSVVTIVNVRDHALLVRDLAVRRRLQDVADELLDDTQKVDLDRPAIVMLEDAERKLFDLAELGESRGAVPLAQAVRQALTLAERAYKRDGKVAGVATGFRDLDKLLGGLHASDLVIVAGRPSMGKTALATAIALSAAAAAQRTHGEDGAAVAFFSLEMPAEQIAARALAEEVDIDAHKLRTGELKASDFDRFVPAAQRLSALPLFIDDTPAASITQLRARARRIKRQHKTGLVVIDYLQLVRGASDRPENRVQEISEITRGLKAMAKELELPVLALSQLSRAVEQREDKRPMLQDLRDSGTIEQDADVVIFVYREEYYLARGEPQRSGDESDEHFNKRHEHWQHRLEEARGRAELIVAKQRMGPIRNVTLAFD